MLTKSLRHLQGVFDCVVIAHNGKCANRLAAPMGVPDVHAQLKRLKLSANWALLVAFASPVPVPGGMEGAFVAGSDVLSWAANNSAKLAPPGGAGSGRATVEAWTLFSTQQYGRANKVPQVWRVGCAAWAWGACSRLCSPVVWDGIPAPRPGFCTRCRRMCRPRCRRA